MKTTKEREVTKMKKRVYKVWILRDGDGNEICRGRKKEVLKQWYIRFVYCHHYGDEVYRTSEDLEEKIA